ncbi:MAG TPA: sigma-70 family RNA polymerase sigma factor [Candidatus Dormibacteraeota bacterium]|nr:sigma-70 family RNA polymerase sigma factor [Candidatus Dormibacteraeota bacterium]
MSESTQSGAGAADARSDRGADRGNVERVLAGDQDAFGLLVERHSRTLFRLAYRMTGNEQDAEEVVQDAFLRAYRKMDRFESRAHFGTWLYRIAVNCALDRMRKRRTEDAHRELPSARADDHTASANRLDSHAADSPAPDRLVLSAEIGARVTLALQTLSPAERVAFVMRHWEGRGIDEISQVLALRASATKNTVFRAVQKLRRALEPLITRDLMDSSPTARAMGATPGSET